MQSENTGRAETIDVASLVSSRTGEPLVMVRWGAREAQFTPDEARALALGVLQAAEAAESDALLVQLVRQNLNGSRDAAAVVLRQFRELRQVRALLQAHDGASDAG